MSQGRVLLAYSGGLDTSCILKWLIEKDYEVICFMADVGQDENMQEAKEKALKIGAIDVIVKDLKKEFIENYIWPSIQMGLIYEGRYLLGTSLARPCISVGLIEVARERNATHISHGATGKGNDQVRFELSAYALYPTVKVIAPWRLPEFCQQFQGRIDLLKYAELHNIPVSATPKEPWSTDANIMHISYESGVLEDPGKVAPKQLYQLTKDPQQQIQSKSATALKSIIVDIYFNGGIPIKVINLNTKESFETAIDILTYLNKIGGNHGIGRIDIVENRFVGLKSRGIYETPGGKILFCAHQDLELFCLDKEVYRQKTYLALKMADYVYNGLWFSPEADYTRKCIELSQVNVSGKVTVEIYYGNVWAIARESNKSLYNQELVSMDVHGEYSAVAAGGFIEINALRIKEYYKTYGPPK